MQNTQKFKAMLENERAKIEAELKTIGKKSDTVSGDWDPMQTDLGADMAESGEVADSMETMENNNAIVNDLEKQLADVVLALKKIDAGTYGMCEMSGEMIEEDRLEANPSARTCKMHM